MHGRVSGGRIYTVASAAATAGSAEMQRAGLEDGTYFTMTSTLPQWAMLFCITLSTVSLTRTSHSMHRQSFSCSHWFICSMVFSCVHPTAVHLSPCDSRARTSERPMWPVAPKTYSGGVSGRYGQRARRQQQQRQTHDP